MELKKIVSLVLLLGFAAFSFWYNQHNAQVQEPQADVAQQEK